jgi:hypothetical protein
MMILMTGRTHRIIGTSSGFVAASAVGLPIVICVAVGGVAGATSSLPDQAEHSVADSMTVDKHGIALLWPISRRGYHLLPRRMRVWVGSKSRSEWTFAACWCVFVLSYVYVRYRHYLPPLSNQA